MKTREERDAMVKRVQTAHKKWPSFEKMPVTRESADVIAVLVKGDPNDNTNYVNALYDLCAKGATPIGRRGANKDHEVVGRK